MLTFISFGHCTWKAFMCQSLSAFSLGCWCYLCDSTSSFLLHLFFFVDVVFFFFTPVLLKLWMHSACFLLRSFHGCQEKHFYPPLVFVRLFFLMLFRSLITPTLSQNSCSLFLSLCGESMTQCCTLHELM